MKRMVRIGVILGVVFSLAAEGKAALFRDWLYKLPITFPNYPASEPLTNFPAVLALGTQAGFDYGQFASGSNADLRFTDASGTLELNYEIEQWNPGGTSYVWVQVPVLTNGAGIIAYWGKSGVSAPAYTTNGVTWAQDYKAVWHMCSTNDSTSNRWDFSISGPATPAPGAVANGYSFPMAFSTGRCDGVNWSPGTQFSVSWAQYLPADGIAAIILGHGWWGVNGGFVAMASGSGWEIGTYQYGNNVRFYSSTTPNSVDFGQWDYYTFTFDNGLATFYKNGWQSIYTTNGMWAPSAWTWFEVWDAMGYSWSTAYTAVRDEVELSTVARSSNWVWACYMNEASNSVFAGYSRVTDTCSPGTIIIMH